MSGLEAARPRRQPPPPTLLARAACHAAACHAASFAVACCTRTPAGFGAKSGTQSIKAGKEEAGGNGGPLGTLFKTAKGGGTQAKGRGRSTRDASTVFVAGATGRLGARIVRELLGQGFKVCGAPLL